MFDQIETTFGAWMSSSTMPVSCNRVFVPLAETDDALFDRLLAVNVKGTFQHPASRGKTAASRRPHRQFFLQYRGVRDARLFGYAGTKSASKP